MIKFFDMKNVRKQKKTVQLHRNCNFSDLLVTEKKVAVQNFVQNFGLKTYFGYSADKLIDEIKQLYEMENQLLKKKNLLLAQQQGKLLFLLFFYWYSYCIESELFHIICFF